MDMQNYAVYIVMGIIAVLIIIGFWAKIGGFL
jgi:hypothetical protein